MDEKPEVIRHRIDETRSALTEKLETLEREVRGTVRDARDAVTCTVENVRDTVNSTVNNVRDSVASTVDTVRDRVEDTMYSMKEVFNLEQQVQAHPWAMLGGSVAAGYVLGSLLPASDSTTRARRTPSSSGLAYSHYADESGRPASWAEPARTAPAPRSAPKEPGFLSSVLDQLAPEIQKVKGMAIGTAMGLLRDLLKQQIPQQLAANVDEVVNSVTTKIGGEPVRGPVLAAFTQASPQPARSASCCDTPLARAGSPTERESPAERRFEL